MGPPPPKGNPGLPRDSPPENSPPASARPDHAPHPQPFSQFWGPLQSMIPPPPPGSQDAGAGHWCLGILRQGRVVPLPEMGVQRSVSLLGPAELMS